MVPEATDAVVPTGEAVQLALATPVPTRTKNAVRPTDRARRLTRRPGARFVLVVMAQLWIPSMRMPNFAADWPWLPAAAATGISTDTQSVAELPAASGGPNVAAVAAAKVPVQPGVTAPLVQSADEASTPTPIVSDSDRGVVDVGDVSSVIRSESGTSPVFVTVAAPCVVRPGYSGVVGMVSGETVSAAVPEVIVAADSTDALELRRAYVPPDARTARQMATATTATACAIEREESVPSGEDDIRHVPFRES